MTTLKVLFWICLILVVYTYVGYGVLLWLLVKMKRILKGKVSPLNMPEDGALPHVTFLICCGFRKAVQFLRGFQGILSDGIRTGCGRLFAFGQHCAGE